MIRWSLPLVALGVVAAVWLAGLQRGMGAANDPHPDPTGLVGPLMDDSGEFVVAWHTWGVTHPPGYPLLNAAANGLVRVLKRLGAGPVVATSLVSWAFACVALALLAVFVACSPDVARLGVEPGSLPASNAARGLARGLAGASALLLPAFGGLVWLYASVAEVYALGIAFAMALICLAWWLGQSPSRPKLLALGLLFGLAVGHHRTLLALVPALAFAAWPARRLGARAWLGAAALAVASLGVYAYLPWAARHGSPWLYGRSPGTLDGMLDALLAREYTTQLAPPSSLPAIVSALGQRLAFLADEMTPLGLGLGAAGLAGALWTPATRRSATMLALAAGGYLAAPVSQLLVIGTHLLIMVASLALSGAWGLAVAGLAARRQAWWGWAGLCASGLAAVFVFGMHRDFVGAYTEDRLGERLVAVAGTLIQQSDLPPDARQPVFRDPPILAEVWGPRYFALAFGKWVTGDLGYSRLVDVRGDLSGLDAWGPLPDTLYTTQDLLHLVPLEQWSKHLGGRVALESAGDGWVALRRVPRREVTYLAGSGGGIGERAGDGTVARDGDLDEQAEAGSEAREVDLAARSKDAAVARDGDIGVRVPVAWVDGPDGDLHLRLEWVAHTPPARDYHVFVQFTDRSTISGPADILAQADRDAPVYGFWPTSGWRTAELVRDDYRVERAALPAGRLPTAVEFGLSVQESDGRFTEYLRHRVPIAPSPPGP